MIGLDRLIEEIFKEDRGNIAILGPHSNGKSTLCALFFLRASSTKTSRHSSLFAGKQLRIFDSWVPDPLPSNTDQTVFNLIIAETIPYEDYAAFNFVIVCASSNHAYFESVHLPKIVQTFNYYTLDIQDVLKNQILADYINSVSEMSNESGYDWIAIKLNVHNIEMIYFDVTEPHLSQLSVLAKPKTYQYKICHCFPTMKLTPIKASFSLE